MSTACQPTEMAAPRYAVKEPKNLSPRIRWLRDFYFQGVERRWNNEYSRSGRCSEKLTAGEVEELAECARGSGVNPAVVVATGATRDQ